MTAPHTEFGKTKELPIEVYVNGRKTDETTWDEVVWVECGEDWYALGSPDLKDKKVRIIQREVWLRCK